MAKKTSLDFAAIVKTLQYMKPDIKVTVWGDESAIDDENRDRSISVNGIIIIYNETESFRPTEKDILAVDQDLVNQKSPSELRRVEYEKLGWTDQFAIFKDMAIRGSDAVNADRLRILNEYPDS